MATFGVYLKDDDHWADKKGYSAENLPPGWTAEKWERRYRRGDVIEILREQQIPLPGNPIRDGVKILIIDESEGLTYEQAKTRFEALDQDETGALLSRSRYNFDMAGLEGKRVAVSLLDLVARETDKADGRG